MATTLVGVFDNREDAQKASQALQGMGIDLRNVQVTSGPLPSGSASAGVSHQQKPHEGGIRGFFASLFGSDDDEETGHYSEAVRRGSCVLTVNLADDSQVDRATDVLQDCGAIDMDERVQQWKAGGYAGYHAKAPAYTADEAASERDKYKVMQEELKVGKRTVDGGGVRVRRRITSEPVSEQLSLHDERVVVDRKPVDRPAQSADFGAFKEGEVELRETSEEAVVSKSARVVEEVSVGLKGSDRQETVRDTVRRTDVEVQAIEGDAASMRPQTASALRVPAGLRYGGPERRFDKKPYAGVERRSAVAAL